MTESAKMMKNEAHSCSYQAYQILHFGFTVLPIIVGLDKFFYFLTDWNQYITPEFVFIGTPHTMMMIAGAIEILVGIGVWVKPKIFSYVVALWLLGIIINLIVLGSFFDVALRDFGLLLGALALGRLSCSHCCEHHIEAEMAHRM